MICWRVGITASDRDTGSQTVQIPPGRKQYLYYEEQTSTRNPGKRAFGRANSGLWFQGAQVRADYLAAQQGHVGPCAVTGVLATSDATYGNKHVPWHAIYGA